MSSVNNYTIIRPILTLSSGIYKFLTAVINTIKC